MQNLPQERATCLQTDLATAGALQGVCSALTGPSSSSQRPQERRATCQPP